MRPTSPWSSTRWTCFTAVGSTDFAWCRRTAILPGLPPASASRASMCLGLASRRPRKASAGVPQIRLYREPAWRHGEHSGCRLESKPLQPPDAATPIIKKVIAQMESEDGWVALGEVGKQLANLASDFDPRTFGFRKLSDLVRKTNAFEIEQPKAGGNTRIRIKPTAGSPAEDASRPKTCGVNDRRLSEPRL